MQSVGHHLQKHAVANGGDDRDSFARSAYNRYYYAVYLVVRDMLARLDPGWERTPHADIPKLLAGKITRTLSSEIKRAKRTGDKPLAGELQRAKHAAAQLVDLMEKAYGVRVTADYNPATLVDFSSAQRFSLQKIDVTEAHNWRDLATQYVTLILLAWRQIHV